MGVGATFLVAIIGAVAHLLYRLGQQSSANTDTERRLDRLERHVGFYSEDWRRDP